MDEPVELALPITVESMARRSGQGGFPAGQHDKYHTSGHDGSLLERHARASFGGKSMPPHPVLPMSPVQTRCRNDTLAAGETFD